jgi:hypothetical protein
MGRVARLILLVVVSVCVVFCVLCCLQNNPVFSSVTILSHISKNENYELCISVGFFVDQITAGKKYDRKKRGGCAIIITTGKKKVLVICLAGARSVHDHYYDQKKKF